MKFIWYFNRLKKMGPAETLKRVADLAGILYSRFKHRDPLKWPYYRFAKGRQDLSFVALPGRPGSFNPRAISIYSDVIDATRPIDWHKSDILGKRWPDNHWSAINYRPDNPHGDIRINWELNRLQFLPYLALTDQALALCVLNSWLEKNPYLHGPGYGATMEVALRWISIYRSVCLMDQYIGSDLRKDLTGLAVASGKCILSRLSSYSSAGNHLIVEAVGLFWIGKALGADPLGKRWCETARRILWREIPAQINPDGTSKEQSFWYLGFVLDAVFHYLLLEDQDRIPDSFLSHIEAALEFISRMILPDGTYPDFGDRDDGYVFRADGDYQESLFNGLLDIGSVYFDHPQWRRDARRQSDRIHFWYQSVPPAFDPGTEPASSTQPTDSAASLRTFPQGGMTVMRWAETQTLFLHGPLGLGNTCGHGHADSLSLLMVYQEVPVLIDLGSAQYNGDQDIRNFFRSTLAHNTVQLGAKNQADIIGPFLWEGSYRSTLLSAQTEPVMTAEACHDGYLKAFNTVHSRKVMWHSPTELEVIDLFRGPGKVPMKGAFHLGACKTATLEGNRLVTEFSDFNFSISFPEYLELELFKGSIDPFIGWRGDIYNSWSPIYTVVFSSLLEENFSYSLKLNIDDQSPLESKKIKEKQ